MPVSQDIALRRFRNLEPSQEGIETVCLWVLHHKDSQVTICNAWQQAFTQADDKLRLSLIYLSNDVVQKAKKKKESESLKMGIFHAVKSISKLIRNDVNLLNKLNRIINIWAEREVFDKKNIEIMRNALKHKPLSSDSKAAMGEATSSTNPSNGNNNNNNGATTRASGGGVFSPDSPKAEGEQSPDYNDKDMLDYDPSTLIDHLERNCTVEEMIERAKTLLNSPQLDMRSKVKESLKDRETGRQVLHEVDETCARMGDFVTALESAVQQHQTMLDVLAMGRAFFGQQLRDATVVEDAYKKFGQGINEVKTQVEEMQRTGSFPAASPPRDAPSPSANDDIFDHGVEEALIELKRPGNRDLIEVNDMELDEETASGVIELIVLYQRSHGSATLNMSRFVYVPTASGVIDINNGFQTNSSFVGNLSAIHELRTPTDPRLKRAAKRPLDMSDLNGGPPPNMMLPPPAINTTQPPPTGWPPGSMYSPTAPPPSGMLCSPPPVPSYVPLVPPPFNPVHHQPPVTGPIMATISTAAPVYGRAAHMPPMYATLPPPTNR